MGHNSDLILNTKTQNSNPWYNFLSLETSRMKLHKLFTITRVTICKGCLQIYVPLGICELTDERWASVCGALVLYLFYLNMD